jgi:hypothetical protein
MSNPFKIIYTQNLIIFALLFIKKSCFSPLKLQFSSAQGDLGGTKKLTLRKKIENAPFFCFKA